MIGRFPWIISAIVSTTCNSLAEEISPHSAFRISPCAAQNLVSRSPQFPIPLSGQSDIRLVRTLLGTSAADLEMAFRIMDVDKSGFLDRNEVIAFLSLVAQEDFKSVHSEFLEKMFLHEINGLKSNVLNYSNFSRFINELYDSSLEYEFQCFADLNQSITIRQILEMFLCSNKNFA